MTAYIARVGLNLNTSEEDPQGTRLEPGDTFDSDDVSDDVLKWLTDGGYAEPEDAPSEFPAHKGGGHYQLSDGTSVQGKQNALDAQAELDEEED